ncbi:lectin-like domain-containing protein [Nocardioides sp. zg-1228]|uniref:DUF7507 domain-containing protein n=1 Tax=Nocardioides sp. zg-1228 TaxID=2763008 RepID=UPI001643514B|nr:sortase [Nocardioides sp. zg-1228]MBC2933824.1 DUF11 domain-containing protein [Nocardioides sp. zg-1228]QSF58597.1 DUF11 domain-containing protein [Nocardioides sp. zg-1228]
MTRRLIATTVTWCMTVSMLALLAQGAAAPASADPPTGGTTIATETFTGRSVADPAWTAQGDSCLTGAITPPPTGAANIPTCATHRVGPVPTLGLVPGYLQLTDTTTQTAGSVLYNKPIPATAGVTITFDQFQYGGTGADGIGFFLVDGATNLNATGAPGGSLGYAQRTVEGEVAEPGVEGGVLGVGLDAYGNYYDDGENRGNGCPEGQRSPSTAEGAVAPNVITLRGPGDGFTGYCYLASTTSADADDPDDPGTTLSGTLRGRTLAASWRQVNITVTPAPDPRVIVQVRYNPANPASPWVTELDEPAPEGLPSTYKFGLSGATGGVTDVHLIRNAVVRTVDPLPQLQLEKQVDRSSGTLPAVITAGTEIPYQYTVTNAGAENLSTLAIADDTITGPITCDATTLPPAPAPGSTTVCRGTYTVTAADVSTGEVVNTAVANAVNPGGETVTSPEATVTVPLVSSLDLAKSVQTDPPYVAGQEVEYLYTVTNTGGSTVTNIAVTDDRVSPASLVCEANVLAPGASTTCTGTYLVDTAEANAAGSIVNTAIARGETPFGQEVESPEAQASIGVNTDIAITKAVDDPTPSVGDTVTFTVTATNNGPAAATDLLVTDLLPAGRLTLQSATTSGPQPSAYGAEEGAWSIPALAVGNAVTLTITARVDTNGVTSNTATLTRLDQLDTDPSNNSATVTLNARALDLAVTKEVIGSGEVAAGEPVTFRVTVTNLGPQPGTGITISEDLPPGLTYLPGQSGGTGSYDPSTSIWTIGALGVDETATFDFVLDTSAAGTFTNAVSLASVSPTDINSANNSDSATVAVRTPNADLVIVKGVSPQEAVVDDTVTYTVTVLNRGPDPVGGVFVTDTGAEGVTLVEADPSQGTVDLATRRWDVGRLASGQSATLTLTARLDSEGTKVNLATVDAPLLDDPTPEDNESSATLTTLAPAVDVAVTKSVAAAGGGSASEIPLGQDAVFTVTATNTGVSGAPETTVTNAVFTDLLQEGLTFVSATGDGDFDPETGTWTVGSIPVGTTVTLTITATGTVVGQQSNTASLSSLDQRDVDPTNNSASAVATFVELADLTITKTVDQPVAQPGDTVVYTITVTNNGPNATDDTIAHDPALIQANITGHTTEDGTFDETSRVWTIPRLESGQTATLEVSVLVGDSASGHYRNLAAIQQTRVEDPNPDDNIDDEELFVPVADIAVTKAVDNPTPVPGATVTFTVGVRNLGPDTAEDVIVNDVLPDGLTYVSSTASRGTYDAATGVWDVGQLAPTDLPATGDQEVLQITAQVTRTGPLTNTASSDRARAVPYDPDTTNNSASATLNGTERPALQIVKTASPATVTAAGQQVQYTFRVTNVGDVPLSAVSIVEDGFTGSGDLPTPTCPPSAARLAPGESVDCTSVYVVTAADLATGQLRNVARATGNGPSGGATSSAPDGAVVEINPVAPPVATPSIRTRTSDRDVEPGERFHDRVRITGLPDGASVPATARLYGPFESLADASCRPGTLARTVRWRAGAGWSRTAAVEVSEPGVYTWQVTTQATATAAAATTRCGLPPETTTVAKPPYVAPIVSGGFAGVLPGSDREAAARAKVRAPGFGLNAPVVPTTIVRGRMRLPEKVARTSWLRRSAGFGDTIGTSVIAGHVSDRSDRPGAMWGLRRAERGDTVTITRGGQTQRYRVSDVATYDRTRKLPQRLFRTTGPHRLLLISCSDRVVYPNGHFHYTKYKVVTAVPIRAESGRVPVGP